MSNIKRLGLFIIRYSPGLAVLVYAYLYFAGYYFLSSYFLRWGLNSHEMGYTIVDYATVGISPLFFFILISTPLIAVAYGLQKRIRNLKNRLLWICITYVPPVVFILAAIFLSRRLSLFVVLMWAIIVLSYMIGCVLYWAKTEAKQTISDIIQKNWFWIILVLIAFIPIFNWQYGREYASWYMSYTSNPFLKTIELSEVNIYSNGPIDGLDLFEESPNKYAGLRLLAFKNDIYYLIASIDSLDIMEKNLKKYSQPFKATEKEITDINNQLEERISATQEMISEGDKLLKKLDATKIQIDKTDPSSKERAGLFAKYSEYIDQAKRWKERTRENRLEIEEQQKLQEEKMETLKKWQELSAIQKTHFANILKKSYAIRKDQINNIEFITQTSEKEK